ncbi:vesicle-associated protein 3-1-like [Cynara cardunculus var. scolymus]|uniref:MSP domain-containing protein n=1 Tax=Cynara cardunculus var. scolymus TaxID=59895 RepID=A0A103XTK8_CYNCS|nr:vesicle-associated protein 3-1-like [Cynara cardunculus var. scolymus]KVH96616.1 hypothetical protein Ccrd_001292 [Cynara cardunculus var. scolymus]
MDADFGEIEPEELKFLFKPKVQIMCIVKLINKSNRYIAYKVKTTRPKLYCVRPNIGIVKPDSTCEVHVTRQAQAILPVSSEIEKEKFLFERMFVPESMALEEVSSIFLSKDGDTDINKKKLKVVFDDTPMMEEMKSKNEERHLMLKKVEETILLRSKIKELDLRLVEAEETISKLKEQKTDDRDCSSRKTRSRVFIKCFNVRFA